MKWYHWMWLPATIVISVVAYFFGRRQATLKDTIALELDVVDARSMVSRKEAELGAISAKKWIEFKYASTIKQLDEDQKNEAVKLVGNPAAFAEFLERAGFKPYQP